MTFPPGKASPRSRDLRSSAARLFIALFLVSCSAGGAPADSATSEQPTTPGPSPAPAASDGVEIVAAVETLGAEVWAPQVAAEEKVVLELVQETLLRSDPETRVTSPGLAESWELSEDEKTWTFRLRPDVPFHGEYGTLSSEDVKFTWGLMIREDATHSRSGAIREAIGGDLENIEIVSDTEFRVHCVEPCPLLLGFLEQGRETMTIQSKKYWEEVGEEEAIRHPIGTGPFEFESHQPGVQVALKAVEEHWRHTPHYDRLVIKVIGDEAARLAQLRSGDVDIAPIGLTLLPEAEAAGLRIFSIPNVGLSNIYMGGNFVGDEEHFDADAPWIQADNPEAGKAVREALSLAIDREAIVHELLMGEGEPAVAPINLGFPGMPYADPSWTAPSYDPQLARQKLAEGGYPDGFEVDYPIFAQGGRPAAEAIAEAVAGMFEEIGITVNRRPMDFTNFRPFIEDRTTAGMVYQFSVYGTPEPAQTIVAGYTATGGIGHFYASVIDEILPEIFAEADFDARMKLYHELGTALNEEKFGIPVATMNAHYVAGDSVVDATFLNGVGEAHNFEYLVPSN